VPFSAASQNPCIGRQISSSSRGSDALTNRDRSSASTSIAGLDRVEGLLRDRLQADLGRVDPGRHIGADEGRVHGHH
jgi:hypothetical protein